MTSSTQSEVISDICDSTTANNDIKFMLKLAKKIREQILSQDWKFTGHFSTYKTPALLSIFLKWVPFGACVSAEKDDTKEIKKSSECYRPIYFAKRYNESSNQLPFTTKHQNHCAQDRNTLEYWLWDSLLPCN